jgi:hypothetical protein
MASIVTVPRLLALAVVGGAALPASASCGSAFCVVNTQWDAQGMNAEAGRFTLDLRYETIRQDQLRRGSHDIQPADVTGDVAELKTLNRNLLTNLDYSIDDHWGVSASLPAVKREHQHIADPSGAARFESWDFSRIGDARIIGRYQLDPRTPTDRVGVQLGLKLPTGSDRVANANGVVAERALQPGSGSTDLLLGGYYAFRPQYRELGSFAQILYQRAVMTRDAFRPGDQLSATAGINYPLSDRTTLLFQLNGLIKQRDLGANAEPDLSGGRFLYASPGASVALTRDTQVYGFIQLPLLANVNGIQLVAKRAAVAGFSMRF